MSNLTELRKAIIAGREAERKLLAVQPLVELAKAGKKAQAKFDAAAKDVSHYERNDLIRLSIGELVEEYRGNSECLYAESVGRNFIVVARRKGDDSATLHMYEIVLNDELEPERKILVEVVISHGVVATMLSEGVESFARVYRGRVEEYSRKAGAIKPSSRLMKFAKSKSRYSHLVSIFENLEAVVTEHDDMGNLVTSTYLASDISTPSNSFTVQNDWGRKTNAVLADALNTIAFSDISWKK